jgi:hypothetical protein
LTEAMCLTRNEHHRKLRAPIGDISDWLMNADVSGLSCWRVATPMYSARKIASLYLPRTTYRLPRTTYRLPRLPAAPHDYLQPTPSPSLRLLREGPETPLPWAASTAMRTAERSRRGGTTGRQQKEERTIGRLRERIRRKGCLYLNPTTLSTNDDSVELLSPERRPVSRTRNSPKPF